LATFCHAQLFGERNRRKSGISPVIAAVILVSIAILLAASLSGFASSFVGVYSSSPQISIRSMQIQDAGTGTIVFYNAGASTDSMISVQVSPNSPVYPAFDYSNSEQSGGNTGAISSGNGNPGPSCTEHSEYANCLHDQGHGHSVDSNGHQNNGNSGGTGNGGQGSGPLEGYNSQGVPLPANSESEVSWYDSSVGEFYPGQTITVHITLGSGNDLTYTTVVSS
jgi:flagellin-like protein